MFKKDFNTYIIEKIYLLLLKKKQNFLIKLFVIFIKNQDFFEI